MVTPTVRMVTREVIIDARTWLREFNPNLPRRAWVDVEHSIEHTYPGGLAAFLNRSSQS